MTMLNHTTAPIRSTGWLTGMRSSLSERRRARATHRALEAELASYRTPAEVEDLFAALRTQDDDPATVQIRTILMTNLRYAQHRTAA
jgi:hypothetical protein